MHYSDEMYVREMNHHLLVCAIEDGIPVSRIGYSNRWTNDRASRRSFNSDKVDVPMHTIVGGFDKEDKEG